MKLTFIILLADTDDELFSLRSKSKLNTSSKSRNTVNVEDNGVYLNDYDRRLKIKMQNKEKKESIIKDSNSLNVVKDASMNASNGDTHLCLKKSNKIDKKEQKINNTSETIVTVIDDSECEIIDENILKRKMNEKLAPLFVKRRKIDSVATAAKRLFLQSDINDVENKNTDCKVNNGTSMLPFPAISHVAQLEDTSDSTRSKIKYKFSMKIEKKYLPSIDISNYKYINCREAPRMTKAINEPVKENVERVLSEMEELYPDVRRMWKTISTIKGDLEKKSPPRMRNRKMKALERKRMLTESVGNEENQSYDWTYKYKPMSAQEIVGNEEAASKLKDWLSGWRASLTKEDDGSSGDEFYSSDCSSSCNNENNQIAVLLGPHGSGKSASVYAIAEELGYRLVVATQRKYNI